MKKRSILSADRLRSRVKGSGIVEETGYDILLVIETDIERAIERKDNKSITELQTNFDIPPMKHQDAQRAVYFFVVKELVRAGYNAKIEFRGSREGEQRVFLHVTWVTKTDEIEIKAMDEYLKKHSYAAIDTVNTKPPNSRRRR